MNFPLGAVIVACILLALLFFVLQRLPLPEPIGTVILVIVTILVVLWIVSISGIGGLTIHL